MTAATSLAALVTSAMPGLAVPATTGVSGFATTTNPATKGSVVLKVRRLSDAVELVIEGTGASPQLVQASTGTGWQGQLSTAQPTGLRMGPQRLSLPEVGMQLVTLSGSGNRYQIDVTPTPGVPLGRPVVSADGQSMILTFSAPRQTTAQTARPNLGQPGAVPQATYAPPLRPRASAPPVGDMAVGTMMLRNTSFINLRGPRVTMTLRNASAKDTLMALARLGQYGFVYVEETPVPAGASTPGMPAVTGSPGTAAAVSTPLADGSARVNIVFVDEDYSRAINAVLLASGLSARLDGRMILAGKNIQGKSFGARLSKVYRLNQVSPGAAADYLANLGASVTKTNTIATSVSSGATQTTAVQGAPTSSTTTTTSETIVESYGASIGPLIGLQATTDSRLGTITLIGDASLVAVAEQYLRQLDLRQRQVALSVKILDVTLSNSTDIANSFAFRYGNNFIVNDNGTLAAAFGGFMPPTAADVAERGIPRDIKIDSDVTKGVTIESPPGVQVRGQGGNVNSDGSLSGRAVGGLKTGVRPNPGLQYPANQFYDFVRATIESQATKILASPTLILSENPEAIEGGSNQSAADPKAFGSNTTIGRARANESFVTVGENVVTSYTVTPGQNAGPAACQPGFSIAGLTFGARVNKIDDNGFVTFSLSPAISASTKKQEIKNCGDIDILAVRRLDTGTVRVRDGQTLILTGVIQDSDIQLIKKWPILGDIPFVGQFFRSTVGDRNKRELVIMVTPKIVNEESGGIYGYGYRPETRQVREATMQTVE